MTDLICGLRARGHRGRRVRQAVDQARPQVRGIESSPSGGQPLIRLTSVLVAFSLLTSAATASAECSWRVTWPNDDRIYAVPWGNVPRGSFLTRAECKRAIENMLQEAMRDQALLIEVPACVCVPGRPDLARSLLLGRSWPVAPVGKCSIQPRSRGHTVAPDRVVSH